MIIEPKWSMRPGDWDLRAFSIILILVGAIPSNSLLVSMGLSKLATFLSPVRRSASSVSNSGPLENSLNDAELQIGISAKLKQFIVSVKQKIQKVVISSIKSSTKPAGADCPSVRSTLCSSEMTSQILICKENILYNFFYNHYNFISFMVIKFKLINKLLFALNCLNLFNRRFK